MISNPTFTDIKTLLDNVVGGPKEELDAHGAFWRTGTRDDFIKFTYRGEPLFAIAAGGGFDVEESNLVKALEGRLPFGRDQGVPGARFRRMPAGLPPMAANDILTVREWIRLGCPA